MVTIDRENGYEAALKEAGLPISSSYSIHAEFLESRGNKVVEELLKLKQPPTGIVVSDDLMSLGVLSTLEELGFHVPEDVSNW